VYCPNCSPLVKTEGQMPNISQNLLVLNITLVQLTPTLLLGRGNPQAAWAAALSLATERGKSKASSLMAAHGRGPPGRELLPLLCLGPPWLLLGLPERVPISASCASGSCGVDTCLQRRALKSPTHLTEVTEQPFHANNFWSLPTWVAIEPLT